MSEFCAVSQRALREWDRYIGNNPASSFPAMRLDLQKGMGEGFQIKADSDTINVSAGCEAGLLYGVFAYIRACRSKGNCFTELNLSESPAFETRMLWSWSRLIKGYRHAPYLNFESVINPKSMANPEDSPEMMRFIRNMAQMGVNALAITHELHHFEIEDFDQHGFRPFYPVLRTFTEYLKSWGISLYLYTASAPEHDFKKNIADTDCSFDPRVQKFYEDFIGEVSAELPLLGGLLIAGGLGGYAGGSLYDCTCGYCSSQSPVKRVVKQIEILSQALMKHGKKLVYTVTTDLPFIMDREVDAVLELLGDIPENTVLSFKDCYHDFEELRYPEHPLFSRLGESAPNGEKRLAVEYELFPEMRGKGIILSSIAGVWAKMFRESHKLGIKSVIGVIETHPDNAHPSMSDWYAWGRLCWNPALTEDELLTQWAALEYPPQTVSALAEVLKKSFHAAGKLVYAKGVQNGSHGMIIPQPGFVRDILNDTWFPGAEKEPDGVIGSDKRQIWLYSQERREQIKNDPEFELFVQALRIDGALTERLLREKRQSYEIYKDICEVWAKTESFFAKDDYRYRELMLMIRRNIADAERFYAYFECFLKWQSGVLTVEELQKTREKHIGTGQECSINTSDVLFGAFLHHLEMTLEGRAFDTFFESVYSLPQYDKSMKLWQVTSI